VPNAKARKLGLDEDAFKPSDDILDQLRRAAEGDESALTESAPPTREPSMPAPELTEAERRVLDRLRQQGSEPGESDFS
jgi:hypothetical protein